MPVRPGPPITFDDLRAEFGGTVANSLGDYRRGAGLVPDIPANSGVPTTGPVDLGDFYSATNATIALTAHTITTPAPGGTAVAGVDFLNNGGLTLRDSTPSTLNDEWWNPNPETNIGALYEVAYTQLVSGDPPNVLAAPLGSYVAITATRQWQLSVTSGSFSGVWRFRVREIANTANFVEADMTVTADATPI